MRAVALLGCNESRVSHIADSGTPLRIHNVSSAGRMPTKNTARHPKYRDTGPATNAAAANPNAHELCTIEIALARNSVGQLSATSVAPVFHSPPIPSPSTKRAAASIAMLVESPDANEHTEYVRMLAINARLRPMRSARKPNNTPPMPEASNVSVPSNPETVLLIPRSRINSASTSAYNMASKASSAHPRAAASRVRRCPGVACRMSWIGPIDMGVRERETEIRSADCTQAGGKRYLRSFQLQQ